MNYKDFPKYDARRILVVLFAMERLSKDATLHYISQEINCTRAEVQRAIESAEKTFMMKIDKDGSVYKIASWGFVNKDVAFSLLNAKG